MSQKWAVPCTKQTWWKIKTRQWQKWTAPLVSLMSWSLHLRLKINLRKGVVLTKNNLTRRNCPGSKKCCFCTHDETIKHLFFQCKFARSTWSIIQIASNLYPPTSVANIFGHWLDGIPNMFKALIRVGAYALIWSLWLCRNDLVFNGKMLLLCRLFSVVRNRFIHGLCYNDRSTNRCSRRYVRGWSRWLRRVFSNMGGSITSGSIHHHLRHRHSVGL